MSAKSSRGRQEFFVIWTLIDFFFTGVITVQCPIYNVLVVELDINRHLDSNCSHGRVFSDSNTLAVTASASSKNASSSKKTEDLKLKSIAPIFSPSHAKKRPTIEPSSSQNSDSLHDDASDLRDTNTTSF